MGCLASLAVFAPKWVVLLTPKSGLYSLKVGMSAIGTKQPKPTRACSDNLTSTINDKRSLKAQTFVSFTPNVMGGKTCRMISLRPFSKTSSIWLVVPSSK